MFLHYIKIAFRNLKKYKSQSVISIVGLAIGFLSFALCNYYVQYHLFFNTQTPHADRIYKLNTGLTENDLRKEFPEIDKLLPLSSIGIFASEFDYSINMEGNDVSYRSFISDLLDPSVIDFFSMSIIAGSKEAITQTTNSIVLFESKAKKLTNNISSLIGKELKIDEYKSYMITGILKDPPENSTFGKIKDYYLSLGESTNRQTSITSGDFIHKYTYYIQLNDKVSKKGFINKLDHYFAKDKADDSENPYALEPFTSLSNFGEYNINIVKFLLIFGTLILLSTLFNFLLFQFSMYYNHLKEYAVRIVNGVNRWQFTLQLFVDIIIKFLLSGIIVLMVIELFFQAFEKTYYDLTYIHLGLPLLRDHLAKYLLYGTIVSFALSYITSHMILKKSARSVSGYLLRVNNKNTGRNILLLIQLLVIVIFISAAVIVTLQTNKMKHQIFSNLTQDDRENIITFSGSYPQLRDKLDVVLQKISNSSDVIDISYSDENVIRMRILSPNYKITGIENQIVRNYEVAFNFCNFFNGNILQGRSFDNLSEYDAAIVNKKFLTLFPGESVIGKTFKYEDDRNTYRIIGVVDHIQMYLINFTDGVESVENIMEDDAVFLRLMPAGGYCTVYVKCKTGKTREVKQHIESCLKEFIPSEYEIDFEALQEKVDSTFSTEKLIVYSSTILFMISLVLGLLSIYSSVLMNIEKRRKEIAIRRINGAELKDVVVLFGKTYVKLWTVACILSFPAIYYYAKWWLEKYKTHITLNVFLFLTIYLVILVFIIAIVISQVIKTTNSNPSDTIKKE